VRGGQIRQEFPDPVDYPNSISNGDRELMAQRVERQCACISRQKDAPRTPGFNRSVGSFSVSGECM
jgi:hypothetical protein